MMRKFRISLLIALSSFLTSAGLADDQASPAKFELVVPATTSISGICLPFHTSKSRLVFRLPAIALKIELVQCDGRVLVPSEDPVGCDPDYSSVPVDAEVSMYQVSLSRLTYMVEREPPLYPVSLEYVEVPQDWQTLIITYRVRHPNEPLSSLIQTTVKRTHDPREEKSPNQAAQTTPGLTFSDRQKR